MVDKASFESECNNGANYLFLYTLVDIKTQKARHKKQEQKIPQTYLNRCSGCLDLFMCSSDSNFEAFEDHSLVVGGKDGQGHKGNPSDVRR